ncbi:MAG: hypothetical protein A2Y62_00160 [Candidatus Fischerbacteria bacterium RBG_13_37_8]|uniref:VWFA domain-containing protein n=1 Tax=Candidatus Fischerbacteria bacterium RBG_13_37_8 TaxID=1817863 RepID=A0A1F5VRH0_9BACT|nr:MAG: hypothetical protein A2Y62_00160 [Candidatus Fischerbacteria bacterium RBG_13_37_8]
MLNVLFKPHREYFKAETDEPQKLFAMLRVIPEQVVSEARPPLAIALVVDTSDSMRAPANHKTKLDYAIEAAHKLIDDEFLIETDLVSIIQFEDESDVILPLSPLRDKNHVHQLIEHIRNYSGATFMGKGLMNAFQQLSKEAPQISKRVILLTDGRTFDEAMCRSVMQQLADTNAPVVSIGIGLEYNQALLREISNETKGYHLHLTDIRSLQNFFAAEIKAMVKEVVTDLQARVAAVKGVTLNSITRVYPNLIEASLTEQPYRLGNIVAGDYTVFIFEFTISDVFRPPSRVRVSRINITGSIPSGQKKTGELPQQELFVVFTKDETLIPKVDPEVLDYVQQKNLDRLVYQAMGMATKGNVAGALRTLHMAQNITQQVQNVQATQLLKNALDELSKTGVISPNTVRTVVASSRTMTIKSTRTALKDIKISEEEIRKLTGA